MHSDSNRFAVVVDLVARRTAHIDSTVDWVGMLEAAAPLAEAFHVEVAVDYLPGDEEM